VAVVVGSAVTLLSAVIVPQASLTFWGRLAHGDTGLGHSLIYYTNQSVMADVVRVFGLGRPAVSAGLAASALVGLAGVWAAVLWHRLGEVPLAVNLCGVAGLLASPVSWLHHFVWVVPLALSLLTVRRIALPRALLVAGWVFVGWVIAIYGSTAAAPFARLPNGADLELEWSWSEQLLASVTAMIGIALIAIAIVAAQRRRLAPWSAEQVEEPMLV
jgi:alpha-1,2-mannosyltransferase